LLSVAVVAVGLVALTRQPLVVVAAAEEEGLVLILQCLQLEEFQLQ
jgi:hypothetical protein